MQPQPSDSDFVILWYLALTLTMFVLVSSKAFEYFAIYRRQRELEDRLDKVEKSVKNQNIVNICFDARLDLLKENNLDN